MFPSYFEIVLNRKLIKYNVIVLILSLKDLFN